MLPRMLCPRSSKIRLACRPSSINLPSLVENQSTFLTSEVCDQIGLVVQLQKCQSDSDIRRVKMWALWGLGSLTAAKRCELRRKQVGEYHSKFFEVICTTSHNSGTSCSVIEWLFISADMTPIMICKRTLVVKTAVSPHLPHIRQVMSLARNCANNT